MHGTVLRYFSNYYYVRVQSTSADQTGAVVLECMAKSLLKKQGITILTGDTVVLDEVNFDNHTGRITTVLPRVSLLKKPKIANVQRVLVFIPLQQPALDLRQLDRLLAHVVLSGLTPTIVFTKADLLTTQPIAWETTRPLARLDRWVQIRGMRNAEPQVYTEVHEDSSTANDKEDAPDIESCKRYIDFSGLDELVAYYQHALGIDSVVTSIVPSSEYFSAIATLAQYLQTLGGNWVLAGVSGAGKSSLLNALNPQFNLKIGSVSDKLERGTHTTRHTELLELFPSVWVADAPGFSHLAFEDIAPEQLQQGFTDFQQLLEKQPCEYPSCLHDKEPNCAIINAVERGEIRAFRHAHYLTLLSDVTDVYDLASKQSHKQEVGGFKQGNRKKQGGGASHVVRLDPKLREANRKQYNQRLNQLHETLETASQESQQLVNDDDEIPEGTFR